MWPRWSCRIPFMACLTSRLTSCLTSHLTSPSIRQFVPPTSPRPAQLVVGHLAARHATFSFQRHLHNGCREGVQRLTARYPEGPAPHVAYMSMEDRHMSMYSTCTCTYMSMYMHMNMSMEMSMDAPMDGHAHGHGHVVDVSNATPWPSYPLPFRLLPFHRAKKAWKRLCTAVSPAGELPFSVHLWTGDTDVAWKSGSTPNVPGSMTSCPGDGELTIARMVEMLPSARLMSFQGASHRVMASHDSFVKQLKEVVDEHSRQPSCLPDLKEPRGELRRREEQGRRRVLELLLVAVSCCVARAIWGRHRS